MQTRYYMPFFALLILSAPSFAGFIGGGSSFNSSKSFDQQEDGMRLDFGSHASDVFDLEFNLVDFGESSYDDPTYIQPDDAEPDDLGSFTNPGFGSASSSDGGIKYTGISSLETMGIGMGLKLKKPVNSWLQVYARASFLLWQSDAQNFEFYGERKPEDEDGDPTSVESAVNQNPCGTLSTCRIDTQESKTQAVDFWYGYGLIAKPFSWLAIRTEYSITTLNAVEFPKAVLEGVSVSLEAHF
jgi:hypothetical protein